MPSKTGFALPGTAENHRATDAHGELTQLCIAAERAVAERIPHQVYILQDRSFSAPVALSATEPYLPPEVHPLTGGHPV